MRKIYLTLFILVVFGYTTFSQVRYQYITIKGGYDFNFNVAAPTKFRDFTVEKRYRLWPAERYSSFTSGYFGSFLFHYDLENDVVGFFGGVDYNKYGYEARYRSKSGDSTMRATYKVQSVGIPLGVKAGSSLFDIQFYVYGGVQFNMNLGLTATEQPSWADAVNRNLDKESYHKFTTFMFVGVNYFIFNAEIDYAPVNFTIPEGSMWGLPDRLFIIKLAVHIPISKWTIEKAKNIRREVRRNKAKRF